MFQNYLKIALRNLQRNRAYTAINVLGLALGMTCGILIFTLVSYHLSFDTFHPESERTYRIVTEQHRDVISYSYSVPSPLGKAIRNDYTFSEKVARVSTVDDVLITVRDNNELRKLKEEAGVAFVETDFFDLFNFPMLQGDAKTALTQPNTAILTQRMARKYFGDANPINKTFRLDNRVDFRVTGVLTDLPANTDRKSEIFVSYNTLKQYDEWLASDDAWGGIHSSMQCYVRLRPGVSPAQVEAVLPAYVKKYRPTSKNVHHYKLQPLADIHFNAQYGGLMTKTNLWVLSLIGLFLLITACVNFINLATAQALNRAKEVSVRKVLGSRRGQLFWQFLAETGLITAVALVFAIGCSSSLLPVVNDLFETQMTLNLLTDWRVSAFVLGLGLLITFLAGSYPGLILARFQPVLALKGRLSQQYIGGFNTRRGLIVAQFAISQLLIIGVIVIANQMRYAKQSNLGFNKDAVVMIPTGSDSKIQTMNTLKARFSGLSGVKKVSLCTDAPASQNNWNTTPHYDNRTEEEPFRVSIKAADDQYVPLFDLALVAGRNLYPSDTVREFVVNEQFAKKLNLKSARKLIGKSLVVNGDMKGLIVGVVNDFHDRSFHEDINPVCITTSGERYSHYAVKIDLATAKPTLMALEKLWSGTHPDQLFEYQFLDQGIAEFYQTDDLMLKLIQAFAAIAIFIGCLGLYGLVSFMAAQKTKEIGIRKVLGSSVGQIVWIFGNEFSRLILIAFVVAAPIAWYVMSKWLQNFKYQIDLGVDVFALTIAGTFLIALLTVSFQSVKAALMNPVKALRSE
jgi:putative ABC transport system permease protein